MKILLTNDDGIFAPGLAAIYKELVGLGDVTVVAPAQTKSGAGHSVTFYEPLVCNHVDVNGLFSGYSVFGSPADCVKLALNEFVKGPVDLVVSGMNAGANVGINVYYSGTVAAAMEAAFYRIPAVAMSLSMDERLNFEQGAKYCVQVLKKLLPVIGNEVLNVNIPRLSKGKPKGIRVVQQSTQGFAEHYVRKNNESNQIVYQLAGGLHRDEEDITDTIALADGFITVTALQYNMTHFEKTNELKNLKFEI
jgi:5'-nucleotidase